MTVRAVSRDAATSDFLDATARGEFLIRVCRECGTSIDAQSRSCPMCRSTNFEDKAASGRARVVSWTVAHQRDPAGGPDHLTVLAIGELAEGPWWWSQIVDADPASLRVGLPLRIDYERPEGSEAVPVFRVTREGE